MNDSDNEIHDVRTQIEDQAIEAIERGATELQLVSELHFGFAVLVFNMWRLVDFLVQVNLDEMDYRVKPRITAKRFQNLVSSVLSTYG